MADAKPDGMDGENELESSTSSTKRHSGSGPSKVILIGKSGVGKSSLFLRIKDGKFHEDIRGQILDFVDKNIRTNQNQTVDMRLYDTAGLEKWHEKTVTRSYYLGSRIALILYSADDMESVDDLTVYIEDINRHAPGAKKFLIRNKIDLEDQTVNQEEVEAKLQKAGYSFEAKWKHKISAKLGLGVEDLLKEVGTELYKQAMSRSAHIDNHRFSSYRKDNGSRKPKEANSPCC